MKLFVKLDYKSNRGSYRARQIIETDPELAKWLIADSPGAFEEYMDPKPAEGKGMEIPTKDKQIKTAPRKK